MKTIPVAPGDKHNPRQPMTRAQALQFVQLIKAAIVIAEPHAIVSSGGTPEHANVWVAIPGEPANALIMRDAATCQEYLTFLAAWND